MFIVNNNNNNNTSYNIWVQMALFNQLTLYNILNSRNDLEAPELWAAVASLSEEQKNDALVFLECNTEKLAGLPDGQGMQAIVFVLTLLDYLPTIEPNTGGNPFQCCSQICVRGNVQFTSQILIFFRSSQRWLQVHRWVQDEVPGDE